VIARADAIGEVSFRLTREQDVELSDAQRAAMLGQNPATLYVGLHAGASFSPRVRGITLIHPSNRETAAASLPGMADRDAARVAASRRIARAIAPALNEAAGQPVRGIVSAPIRPLHGSVAPGVVIELGYLSNADDAALLATDACQNRLADGIVAGLQRYLAADANGAGGGR